MAEQTIRDTLFGDMPIDEWAHGDENNAPWSQFLAADRLAKSGNRDGAIATLRQIAGIAGLESRHYLEAWHELRRLGIQPADESKRLLGVVVEVGLDEGLDLLAAYADRSARYFNYSGAGIVWDRPEESLDPLVDALLAAGTTILDHIGPWEGERPAQPPTGYVRINMLAPGGLFFGQAPFAAFSSDPLAAPALNAATHLMQALIEKTQGVSSLA